MIEREIEVQLGFRDLKKNSVPSAKNLGTEKLIVQRSKEEEGVKD